MRGIAWIGIGGGRRDGGREALALTALAAFAAGVSVGGLAGRMVAAPEGQALVALVGETAGRAYREGALAFWLAAAVVASVGVAAVWLCGLSVVAAPAALAAPGIHGLGVGFAAALFWSALGLPGLAALAAGTAVPLALFLPLWLWSAVEALAFAHAAARRRGGRAAGLLAAYGRVGALLWAGALAAAAVETVVARPLLAVALRLTGV